MVLLSRSLIRPIVIYGSGVCDVNFNATKSIDNDILVVCTNDIESQTIYM